jgi:integrase
MEKYKLAKLYDAGGDLSLQWYVYYQYKHPETKKFQRFKKTISIRLLTKTARYAAAATLIKEINKWLRNSGSPFNDAGSISLSDALDLFLKTKQHALRLRTFYTYRNYVTILKKFLAEKKLLQIYPNEFTPEWGTRFFDWLIPVHGIGNRTFNNYRVSIKSIFRFMEDRHIIDVNPIGNIPKLELEESAITRLTPGELKKMKEDLPGRNYPLYAIANLVYYCFLRPQEIVRLRVDSFDLVHQRIFLSGKTTKNKRTQVIVIPDPLLEILIDLKNLNAPADHFIFSNHLLPGTRQIAPTRIAETWRKWADSMDISKGIYQLKHTGIGMCIESGAMGVRDLQLQLRHSSLDETQKYLEKFNNVASDRLKKGFPRF